MNINKLYVGAIIFSIAIYLFWALVVRGDISTRELIPRIGLGGVIISLFWVAHLLGEEWEKILRLKLGMKQPERSCIVFLFASFVVFLGLYLFVLDRAWGEMFDISYALILSFFFGLLVSYFSRTTDPQNG